MSESIDDYYKIRFEAAERAFHILKAITKKVSANDWTPEYKELADAVHMIGRQVFYKD